VLHRRNNRHHQQHNQELTVSSCHYGELLRDCRSRFCARAKFARWTVQRVAIYEAIGQPVVANAMEGKSNAVVAFGASGSGKTYSMFGTPAAPGLIPRILDGLLSSSPTPPPAASHPAAGPRTEVRMSIFEVYNESIRDLLNPSTMDRAFKAQIHPWRGVHIEGLTSLVVQTPEEAAYLVRDSAVPADGWHNERQRAQQPRSLLGVD
jgi:hypothetical protein